jgi:hypothetical protein
MSLSYINSNSAAALHLLKLHLRAAADSDFTQLHQKQQQYLKRFVNSLQGRDQSVIKV